MKIKINEEKLAALSAELEKEGGKEVDLGEYSDGDLLILLGGVWMMEEIGTKVDISDFRAEAIRRAREAVMRMIIDEGYGEIDEI